MTTGTIAWQVSVPGKLDIVPAVSGGAVYGATNNGVAFALDAISGAALWEVPIRGVPYGAAVTGGLMLVGTDWGPVRHRGPGTSCHSDSPANLSTRDSVNPCIAAARP